MWLFSRTPSRSHVAAEGVALDTLPSEERISALREEVLSAQYREGVVREEADRLRHELDRSTREVELLRLEVKMLTGIIERDRRRVEAETARYNRKIADAETRPE